MTEPRKPKKTYGKKVTSQISGWFARDLWNAAVPAAADGKTASAATKRESESSGRSSTDGAGRRDTERRSKPLTDDSEDDDSDDSEDESAKKSQTNGSRNCTYKARAPIPTTTTTTTTTTPDSDSDSDSDSAGPAYSDTDTVAGVTVTVTVTTANGSPQSSRRTSTKLKPNSDPTPTSPDSDTDSLNIPGTPEHEELEANILALLTPTPSPTPTTSDKENDLPAHARAPISVPTSPREALKERPLTPVMSPARKNGVRKKNDQRTSLTSPLRSSFSGLERDIKVWEDGKEREEREMTEKMRRVTILEIPVGLEKEEEKKRDAAVVIDLTGTPGKGEDGYGSDGSELSEPEVEEEVEEEEEKGGKVENYNDYYDDGPTIDELLALCTDPTILDFTAHIDTLQSTNTLTKLGEASYSEVFLSTPHRTSTPPTVLKIIPFGSTDQCDLRSILQEVNITRALAPMQGFIGFHGAHVCRGYFPDALMACWDTYEEERGSENERPEFYEDDQLWVVVGLEMGGVDLEHFDLRGWREAEDVFWQVTEALAEGERTAQFEHRDLHYGNIVIQRLKSGLKVSLIDYTLSRALCPAPIPTPDSTDSSTTAHFAPLDDPALFSGKGDYQFDIYRFMRTHLSSGLVPPDEEDIDWNVYAPRTNVFWLHYLAVVLLRRKGLARGRRIAGGDERAALERLEAVERGIDPRRKRFGEVPVGSAGEVVAGWGGGNWLG